MEPKKDLNVPEFLAARGVIIDISPAVVAGVPIDELPPPSSLEGPQTCLLVDRLGAARALGAGPGHARGSGG